MSLSSSSEVNKAAILPDFSGLANLGKQVFETGTTALADATYDFVPSSFGWSEGKYHAIVKDTAACVGIAATAIAFHKAQSSLLLPATTKIISSLGQMSILRGGILNFSVALGVNATFYTPFGTVISGLSDEITEIPHAKSLVSGALFLAGGGYKLANPLMYAQLFKNGWYSVPKEAPNMTIFLGQKLKPKQVDMKELQALCKREYLDGAKNWAHSLWRNWVANNGDPCAWSKARVVFGLPLATLSFAAETEETARFFDPLTERTVDRVGAWLGLDKQTARDWGRFFLFIAMVGTMAADKIDGSRAGSGEELWVEAAEKLHSKKGNAEKVFKTLAPNIRRALATLKKRTPEGANMDATLDKLLMNYIYGLMGVQSAIRGDAVSALIHGSYGHIVDMDDAKNLFRESIKLAKESKYFKEGAVQHWQGQLSADKTGKHKTGSAMVAACAAVFKIPGVDEWLKENFGTDTAAMGDFVAQGATFYALNASKVSMPTYLAKAEAAKTMPFLKNIAEGKSGTEVSQLALKLGQELDDAIIIFKRWA